MNKESLKRLTIEELRGQLVAVKESYRAAASELAVERQAQLAKAKAIKGKGAKQKRELIEQILKMERETQRVRAKINQIKMQSNLPYNPSYTQVGKIKVQGLKNGKKDKVPKTYRDANLEKGSEKWAAIKIYKDNVKRGVIKEKNDFESLQSDEQADYAYEVMNEDDYNKYVKLENDKAAELEARDLARAAERNTGDFYNKKYGDLFGF